MKTTPRVPPTLRQVPDHIIAPTDPAQQSTDPTRGMSGRFPPASVVPRSGAGLFIVWLLLVALCLWQAAGTAAPESDGSEPEQPHLHTITCRRVSGRRQRFRSTYDMCSAPLAGPLPGASVAGMRSAPQGRRPPVLSEQTGQGHLAIINRPIGARCVLPGPLLGSHSW